MTDKRYYIGPHGHRVTVEGDGNRAEHLGQTLEDLGYTEVTEDEYLARNVRKNELVTY